MSNVRPSQQRLETAIDALVESYDGPEEINNLESAALPNRRAVLEAYQLLLPTLYMGYYSTVPLDRDNLKQHVGKALKCAYETLVEQIRRAVTYQRRGRADAADGRDWSQNAVLHLFERLPEMRRVLNTDALAAFNGDPSIPQFEEVVFSIPGLRAITAHRVAHVLFSQGVPLIPRILSEYAHSETGIDIHPGAQIGSSFFIDHGTGVVIGETARIGNNVKLYQDVTLGALSISRRAVGPDGVPYKRHPTIEDDVTIYSGAKILGGKTVIGRGSVIGANAWLMASVPAGTKIMGRGDNAP
jgi:serine O-acetyltransferase